MTTIQNDSIIAVTPYLYKYGLLISNDATTPNTKLNIAAGQCRDSTNSIDMGIGSLYVVPYQSIAVSAPITLNAAVNGVNGLDSGSLGASKMYAVYLIGDSRNLQTTATLLSLASNSSPTMPLGYDSWRLIGYWATDASSHFLLGYYAGQNNDLVFKYDAPQATAITAGNATSYTAVDLSAFVPVPASGINIPVSIAFAYTPATAGNTFKMQPVNATGDAVTITGQVASVVISDNVAVLAQLASSKAEIKYKVGNGSDAVAINVAGFSVSI